MNTEECDTPHQTFNWQFDAFFAEDCCDSDGHLHHVCQGKLGMGLVTSYLSKINWMGFPLDHVVLKLQHLATELKHHQCVLDLIVWCATNKLSGEQTYHGQHIPSILLWSSRMQQILRHCSCLSSAKPLKSFTLTKHKIVMLLLCQPQIWTCMHCHHLVWLWDSTKQVYVAM